MIPFSLARTVPAQGTLMLRQLVVPFLEVLFFSSLLLEDAEEWRSCIPAILAASRLEVQRFDICEHMT